MRALDAIYQTTTTTGTGSLTLSTVSGFLAFSDRYATGANGERFPYEILTNDSPPQPLERGIGYIDGSGNLVRAAIIWTITSGTFDNLAPTALSLAAGTKIVVVPVSETINRACAPAVQNLSGLRYHINEFINWAGSTSTSLLVANKMMLYPFRLGIPGEFSGLAIHFSTGVAATNARAGIYNINESGLPHKLLCEWSAAQSSASSVTVVGSFASNVYLQPGDYVLGVASDGGPTLGGRNSVQPSWMGTETDVARLRVRLQVDHTFGALPDPCVTTGALWLSTASSSFAPYAALVAA